MIISLFKRIDGMFHRLLFTITLTLFFTSSHSFASEKKNIIIHSGAYQNAPKIYISENGKIEGFWPELLSIIAAKENWDIQYFTGSWEENLDQLKKGRIDLMPDVAFTKNRAELFDFANTTVMASWSRVYTRETSIGIKTIEDLQGKRIGGLMGSVNVEGPDGIKALVRSFNLNSRVIEFQSYNDVFDALKAGFVDAVITNRNFGDDYIRHNPIKKTPIMLSPVALTFAFPKNSRLSEKLIRTIDFHLSEMMNDSHSQYYTLLAKYFETEIAEKKVQEIPHWLVYLVFGIVVIMAILVAAYFICDKKVKLRTAQLMHLNNVLNKKIEEETEKRTSQEKLLFAQQKHADMGQMMKSVAHQWRQPLNSIYMISQFLQEEFKELDIEAPEITRAFSQQEEIIHHMSDTIADFQYFFKPEKCPKLFNVTGIVLKCMRLVAAEMANQNIRCTFICKYGDEACEFRDTLQIDEFSCPNIILNGYEGVFKQVVLNILGNSIQALSDCDIHHRRIDISLAADDKKIELEISDTGGGINPQHIEKVFDPYFTTKPEGKGMGLGLYICRSILEKHMHGSIDAKNKEEGLAIKICIKKI